MTVIGCGIEETLAGTSSSEGVAGHVTSSIESGGSVACCRGS